MIELSPGIRNTVRALIIQRDRVLLQRKLGGLHGERFTLPGGGQDLGEDLRNSLLRECREEIGTEVMIGELLHVVEFFKIRDTQPPSRRHLVEFVFLCHVPDDYSPGNGPHPDKHQVDVQWAQLDELVKMPLHPRYLLKLIDEQNAVNRVQYLGIFHDEPITQEH